MWNHDENKCMDNLTVSNAWKYLMDERYQYSRREIERAPLDVANDNYIVYLLTHFISGSIYHIQLDKCLKLSFSNDFTKHICNLIFRPYKWSMTKIRCHLLPTKMAWHSICFPSCRNLEPCNYAQDQGNLTKAQTVHITKLAVQNE